MYIKRKKLITFFVILMLCLCACGDVYVESEEDWGSFTAEDTMSYDGKYLAKQGVEKDDTLNMSYVRVDVFDVKTGKMIDSFFAGRAFDFWGICWESDSYNIWVQSGDTGVTCYLYEDGKWSRDVLNSVERPADIISKYDDVLSE